MLKSYSEDELNLMMFFVKFSAQLFNTEEMGVEVV